MRSSAPVATSQTSHHGLTRRRRPASDATTPSPDALSLAPGPAGTESVWAMTMRRQLRGVSKTPITLRDGGCPGTRNSWVPTRSSARRKTRAISL